jgi:hypothetical protein
MSDVAIVLRINQGRLNMEERACSEMLKASQREHLSTTI